MSTCGQSSVKTWNSVTTELKANNYNGPWDHNSMIAAYEHAAGCTPVIQGYNDAGFVGNGSPPATAVTQQPVSTPASGTSSAGTIKTGIPQLDSAVVWAQANPVLAVGLLTGGILLLTRGKL